MILHFVLKGILMMLHHNLFCITEDQQVLPDPQPSYTPEPAPIEPVIVQTTEASGYNYPVPEVTLPIRPVTTTQAPVTLPPTLYGAPPESVPRNGRNQRRRGRNGRRRGRQGRRLRNGSRRAARRISQEELVKKYVFV